MNPKIFTALFLLTASLGLAAQAPPASKTSAPVASSSRPKAKHAKAPMKRDLVDINSAPKEVLRKLPGITDAYADKIIKGRPYLTKAHLVTHDIITAGLYESIKKRIYAGQQPTKR